ncbi:MAG: FAD:protein FMN transferase [Oscillospiraceae bacterium]|nr:FAD:protein FMN transferase [Oscillospiraceae bacterium]
MDTVMSVRACGADEALLAQAEALVLSLEEELSTTREGSAVYTLDHEGHAELSERAAYLLGRALALCAETDGALDVSVYPVVRAWGFTTADGSYRVPDAAELDALLQNVDYTRVLLDGTEASVPEGMEIDLGAVTKGYTGDLLTALLRESGVESALLDLGGNVQTVGCKPDGSNWRVGVKDPAGEGLLGALAVADKAVVTSGGYERYFTDDAGTLYWHIMDPRSGCPARNGLISVTVVGDEGLYCDALSTALFVMGTEDAIAFWRAHRDFDMVLVTEDGRLLLTPALAERFTPADALRYETAVIADA